MPRGGWMDVFWRVVTRVVEDYVSVMAGGIAFFALLAIIPALGAFISIAGLVFEQGTVIAQMSRLQGVLPDGAIDILRSQAEAVSAKGESGLGIAALGSLAITLFSASRGVNNLIDGINLAHGEVESRNFVMRNIVAIVLTLLLLLLAVVGLGAIIVIPTVSAFLGTSPWTELIVSAASFSVLAILSMASLAIVYRYAPARRAPKWQWASVGSVLATMLWLFSSALFSFYVANFGSYNDTYGALGGVVILLLWMWLSCFVVLLGAQINAELEHQTRHDTTRGPSRPMGQRGAYMADTLGDSTR